MLKVGYMKERLKMKDKEFALIFWCGYDSNENDKPTIDYCSEKDISEDNGYDEEDIKEIKLIPGKWNKNFTKCSDINFQSYYLYINLTITKVGNSRDNITIVRIVV